MEVSKLNIPREEICFATLLKLSKKSLINAVHSSFGGSG